jgi:hypothetical protein
MSTAPSGDYQSQRVNPPTRGPSSRREPISEKLSGEIKRTQAVWRSAHELPTKGKAVRNPSVEAPKNNEVRDVKAFIARLQKQKA